MDFEFSSKEELYHRVGPALRSKVMELKRFGYSYIKETDVWNFLIETKWCKAHDLMLSDIVNDILKTNNEKIDRITLGVAGSHNVSNSLECIALCLWYKLPIEMIKEGLIGFTGASRRLEYKGKFNGADVYDDYGHHPTEIVATSNSVKNKKHNKSREMRAKQALL